MGNYLSVALPVLCFLRTVLNKVLTYTQYRLDVANTNIIKLNYKSE